MGDSKMERLGLKLQNASVAPNTALRYVKISDAIADPGRKVSFQKDSDISHKRAAAGSEELSIIMTEKFKKQYEADYHAGLITTPQPQASQVWNGDEIGLPPCAGSNPTFTLQSCKFRSFRIVTGEKAPFWVSVLFSSCADGTTIPPMIVHQSGGDTYSAVLLDGLPVDFVFHTTESGYMDQDGFKAFAEHFAHHTNASFGNMQYLYIDGHDSHFDPTALRYLLDKFVRCMFLKSNDSINDQPQDHGPNSSLKAFYDKEYFRWSMRYPGEKYTAPHFNKVFANAWKNYISNPRLSHIITEAFRKTGIYPMTALTGNLQSNTLAQIYNTRCDSEVAKKIRSDESVCVVSVNNNNSISSNSNSSDTTTNSGGNPHIIARVNSSGNNSGAISSDDINSGGNSSSNNIMSSGGVNTDSSNRTNNTGTTRLPPILLYRHVSQQRVLEMDNVVVNPKDAPQMVRVVISEAVAKSVDKSYVVPAQELQHDRERWKDMSGIKLTKHAADSCKNPSTRTGACVVESLLVELDQVKENREKKKREEADKQRDIQIKKGLKHIELENTKKEFLEQVAQYGSQWRSNTGRERLNLIYKSLGGALPLSSFKVEGIKTAIQELLDSM